MEKQRDLIGYGNRPPLFSWPAGAKLAINFVINYEEGSERSILDQDDQSEDYLTDFPGIIALKNQRHLSSESLFEYGCRVGIWRLLQLFENYQLPITLFCTAKALERNLPLACALAQNNYEIVGHGYRWINYRHFDIEKEKKAIQSAIALLEQLTKKKIYGWYTGRSSENTRKLIVEAGLLYDSDSYNDDLPYYQLINNKPHLIVPYTLDTNDARYATSPGFNTGAEFFSHLKATFDYLYRESNASGKMMTIGLHARLSGKPGRAEALRHFIEYISQFEKIWICQRIDIARFWYQNHPSNGEKNAAI